MNTYSIRLEISGPTAMWTRPDTGDAPVSYPAPTLAAVKGIFESILWLRNAEVVPTHVEICRPVVFHRYFTNYGGPLRKGGGKDDNSHQLIATVLVNVCYRLYAEVVPYDESKDATLTSKARAWKETQNNGAHAYMDQFKRRLKRQQFYQMPCLGWKEFTPDYVGEFRADTRVEESVDGISIPSMLLRTFKKGQFSHYDPEFKSNGLVIRKGVLRYDQ